MKKFDDIFNVLMQSIQTEANTGAGVERMAAGLMALKKFDDANKGQYGDYGADLQSYANGRFAFDANTFDNEWNNFLKQQPEVMKYIQSRMSAPKAKVLKDKIKEILILQSQGNKGYDEKSYSIYNNYIEKYYKIFQAFMNFLGFKVEYPVPFAQYFLRLHPGADRELVSTFDDQSEIDDDINQGGFRSEGFFSFSKKVPELVKQLTQDQKLEFIDWQEEHDNYWDAKDEAEVIFNKYVDKGWLAKEKSLIKKLQRKYLKDGYPKEEYGDEGWIENLDIHRAYYSDAYTMFDALRDGVIKAPPFELLKVYWCAFGYDNFDEADDEAGMACIGIGFDLDTGKEYTD